MSKNDQYQIPPRHNNAIKQRMGDSRYRPQTLDGYGFPHVREQ